MSLFSLRTIGYYLDIARIKAWDMYSQDVGKSLIHLGALGWALSALGQLRMIHKNKDIDKKEKDFLLMQEKADGIINVGLYYTICQGIKFIGDQLLEKSYFMPKKTFNAIIKIKRSSNSISDYVKAMNEVFVSRNFVRKGDLTQGMTNFHNGCISVLDKLKCPKGANIEQHMYKINKIFEYNPMIKETFEPILKRGQIDKTRTMLIDSFNDYTAVKNGAGVIAAVLASVIACNIITPITRNKVANYFHNKKLKSKALETPQKTSNVFSYQAYTQRSLPKVYNGFKI